MVLRNSDQIFNSASLEHAAHTHTYIYIYVCVCVLFVVRKYEEHIHYIQI